MDRMFCSTNNSRGYQITGLTFAPVQQSLDVRATPSREHSQQNVDRRSLLLLLLLQLKAASLLNILHLHLHLNLTGLWHVMMMLMLV